MEYAEHGNDVQYYDWSINDNPSFRWYAKNFADSLAYLLGMNILLRIGILTDLGDGKVEARIILRH